MMHQLPLRLPCLSARRFTLLACLALLSGLGNTAGAAEPRSPPNILLIVADDLGYETLGCYGGLDFSTPHLDRLAAQGMRFGRAYASPVCTPSRMSLSTGTYVTRHGYDYVLPEHEGSREAVDFRDRWTTYAQLLRAAGYQTSVTGKWQLGPLEFQPGHCRDAGFDSWCVWQIWRAGAKTERHWNPCLNQDGRIRADVADRFGPDVLVDYVIDRMRAAVAAGRPFCIQHNELLPHTPIVETPRDRGEATPKSIQRMVASMDELCGRILAEVDRLGIADDTIVIFTGDNGTALEAPRRTVAGAPVHRRAASTARTGRPGDHLAAADEPQKAMSGRIALVRAAHACERAVRGFRAPL